MCSSVVELVVRWVVGSIPYGEPNDLFIVSTSGTGLA